MEIRYDKEADAIYIELKKGKFAKNRKIDDLMVIDMDKAGKLLGIELLNVSKQMPAESLAEVHVKNGVLGKSIWDNQKDEIRDKL